MNTKHFKSWQIQGLELSDTECFDVDISLKLTRKKTNEEKELLKDKNHYRMASSTQPFDYLPLKNRKAEPAKFYELNFRIVRFSISKDTYETVVTNLDKDTYSLAKLKKLYASRWGIETSFRDLKYTIGLLNFHTKRRCAFIRKSVVDRKRLIMLNIPYVIVFYLVDKLAWLYRHCIGDSLTAKAGVLFLNLQMAFENPFPSVYGYDLLAGIVGAVIVRLIVYMQGKNAKKYRHGVEYASARRGTPKDIAPFIAPVFENNILLTQMERLTMNSRPKLPKYARNKNVIIIGGSGSGKTRFYVKPQLMQMTPNVSVGAEKPVRSRGKAD